MSEVWTEIEPGGGRDSMWVKGRHLCVYHENGHWHYSAYGRTFRNKNPDVELFDVMRDCENFRERSRGNAFTEFLAVMDNFKERFFK